MPHSAWRCSERAVFLMMATHHARCVSSCWCGNTGSQAIPHLLSMFMKRGGAIYGAVDGWIDGTSIHVEVMWRNSLRTYEGVSTTKVTLQHIPQFRDKFDKCGMANKPLMSHSEWRCFIKRAVLIQDGDESCALCLLHHDVAMVVWEPSHICRVCLSIVGNEKHMQQTDNCTEG